MDDSSDAISTSDGAGRVLDGCSYALQNVQPAVVLLCLDHRSSRSAVLVVLSHRDFVS